MREDIKKRIKQAQRQEALDGYVLRYKYLCPNDWKMYRLGEITKRVSVKNKSSKEHPTYSISNQFGFIPQDEQFAQGSYNDLDKSDYKIVHQGEFAYNPARINVGSIGLLKDVKTAVVSSLYVCFSMKEACDTNYFAHWIQTYDFYKEVLRNLEGSVREYLFYENFSNICIVIPAKREQLKIAQILNHCDKIIELKRQLIEEEHKRKKCLIQQLLDSECDTHGIHVNCERTSASLGQLFEFGPSLSASRADLGNEGVCYLHYGDIHGNSKTFVDVQAEYANIPKLLSSNPDRFLLRHGDVVFVDASEDYNGASKYVVVINPTGVPLVSGLHTIPARSKTQALDIDYKKYCFQSGEFKKQVAFYVSGMKVYGLNKENLSKIKVAYPPLAEQRAIAKLLISVDTHIDLLTQELSQWQQKKKALMQLLLTGLVRV